MKKEYDNKLTWDEFDPVSWETWKEKIKKDLKDKSIEDLNFEATKGVDIGAFHHRENAVSERVYPFADSKFEIRQRFYSSNNKALNDLILKGLKSGVQALDMDQPASPEELNVILKDVFVDYISLHFEIKSDDLQWLKELSKLSKNKGDLNGTFNYSPWSKWVFSGEKIEPRAAIQQGLKFLGIVPNFKPFCSDVRIVNNKGGSTVQELYLALSIAHEYMVGLLEEGLSSDDAARLIHFKMSTSASFFLEIAKFRALRLLWAKVLLAYEVSDDVIREVYVCGESSYWNKTVMDENNNLLRLTTETMSGMLGNVNSFNTLAFDVLHAETNDESLRRSRNIQHLLLDESFVDKVKDSSGGSYFIEKLTEELCEKAWTKFKEIEAKGGLSEIQPLDIQNEIKSNAIIELKEYKEGRKVLIGVNKFNDSKGKINQDLIYTEDRIAKEWEEKA